MNVSSKTKRPNRRTPSPELIARVAKANAERPTEPVANLAAEIGISVAKWYRILKLDNASR